MKGKNEEEIKKQEEEIKQSIQNLEKEKEQLNLKANKLGLEIEKMTVPFDNSLVNVLEDGDYFKAIDSKKSERMKYTHTATETTNSKGKTIVNYHEKTEEEKNDNKEKIEELSEEIEQLKQKASKAREIRVERIKQARADLEYTKHQLNGVEQMINLKKNEILKLNLLASPTLDDILNSANQKEAISKEDPNKINQHKEDVNEVNQPKDKVASIQKLCQADKPNVKAISQAFLECEAKDRNTLWSAIKNTLSAPVTMKVAQEVKTQLGGYEYGSFDKTTRNHNKDLVASSKKLQYTELKGDALKTTILQDIKLRIDKATTNSELTQIRKDFKDEIAILAKAQGRTTQLLSPFLKTDSIVAFNTMMSKKEQDIKNTVEKEEIKNPDLSETSNNAMK